MSAVLRLDAKSLFAWYSSQLLSDAQEGSADVEFGEHDMKEELSTLREDSAFSKMGASTGLDTKRPRIGEVNAGVSTSTGSASSSSSTSNTSAASPRCIKRKRSQPQSAAMLKALIGEQRLL